MISAARKNSFFLELSAQKIWHEYLTEGQPTTKQEAAFCTPKVYLQTFPLKRRPLKVTPLLLKHDPTSEITLLSSYRAVKRDVKINNTVCSCWWLKSVHFYHLLLPPTTTQLCLHRLLNICFVLFKNYDLVHQNRRLITTSAQTHMQNPVFTKDISQIATVSSNRIQKHLFHTSTSKCGQHAW